MSKRQRFYLIMFLFFLVSFYTVERELAGRMAMAAMALLSAYSFIQPFAQDGAP